MNSEKYIGLDVPSSNYRGRSDGFHGQVSHGIHSGKPAS